MGVGIGKIIFTANDPMGRLYSGVGNNDCPVNIKNIGKLLDLMGGLLANGRKI